MANEDSVLREVNEALEEERQWAFFQKNGPALIAGAVLLVAGVAGWQFWTHMQTEAAKKQAIEFRNAVELLAENPEAGRSALETVAAENGGYGALAALRRANSYASGGERLKAIEIYREVAAGDAPRRLREFAQLRAALLSLNDGRDAVMSDLGDLPDAEGPYRYHTKEILGLASLNAKDYESAVSTFETLSLDETAPAGVRDRATEFAQLAKEARAGVRISGDIAVEDLLESLGPVGETGDAAEAAPEDAAATTDADVPADEGAPEETDADAVAEDDHDDHNHQE